MNRWEMITQNNDDEVWEVAEQVIEREWLDDGTIRWLFDSEVSDEEIRNIVPSVVSVEAVERPEEGSE